MYSIPMILPSYKPRKKFMELAIAEAKRAGDRGDYPIGAVITRIAGGREVVIASAGNRVKTSGSSIKHVELETLKYVSSGYGRYLPDFVLYSTHEPCAMCAGACVWSRIGAVVYGVSQEDIAAYGRRHGTEERKWRACLDPLPPRLPQRQSPHPRHRRFPAKQMPKAVQLLRRPSLTRVTREPRERHSPEWRRRVREPASCSAGLHASAFASARVP
jgi:tRNA(Arg) A34 adenosine deaminase TadA